MLDLLFSERTMWVQYRSCIKFTGKPLLLPPIFYNILGIAVKNKIYLITVNHLIGWVYTENLHLPNSLIISNALKYLDISGGLQVRQGLFGTFADLPDDGFWWLALERPLATQKLIPDSPANITIFTPFVHNQMDYFEPLEIWGKNKKILTLKILEYMKGC